MTVDDNEAPQTLIPVDQNPISDSPNTSASEAVANRIPSNIKKIKTETESYSLEQLKAVWYLGLHNGATLWQYSQDNKLDLPSSFEKGVQELLDAVKSERSLKDLAGNTMMLLLAYAEIVGGEVKEDDII